MIRRLLRGLGGRSVAGIADAGISSVGNLAVSVGAARSLPLDSFGVFSLAVLGGFLSVGLSRSLHGDKFVLLHAASPDGTRREAARTGLAATLVASGGAGVCVVALGGLFLSGSSRQDHLLAVVALGLVLPALCLQDFYRSLAYARGRPGDAVINSGVWTLFLLAGLAVMALSDIDASASAFIGLWGCTAFLGALAGAVRAKVAPGRRSWGWYRTRPELGARLVADFVLLQATAEGSMMLIAAVTGPEGIGLLRKAQLPLAAITVITTGLIAVLQPAFVRTAAVGRTQQLVRSAWAWGAAAFVFAVSVGAVVWALPFGLVELLVGDDWQDARELLPPLTLYLSLGAFAATFGIALRAMDLLRQQVRVRVVAVPLILLAIGWASYRGGVSSASWALALCTLALSAAWVALLQRPSFHVRVTP